MMGKVSEVPKERCKDRFLVQSAPYDGVVPNEKFEVIPAQSVGDGCLSVLSLCTFPAEACVKIEFRFDLAVEVALHRPESQTTRD